MAALPYTSQYGSNYDYYSRPVYNFGYSVQDPYTYQNFGHEESRNGDNTKGQYFVNLPDGRRQVVTYYVNGDSGFVADVKYIGEAKYPTYYPKPAYYPKPVYPPYSKA
jgi:hypothetical protein